jgi:hypothetical protein
VKDLKAAWVNATVYPKDFEIPRLALGMTIQTKAIGNAPSKRLKYMRLSNLSWVGGDTALNKS